MLEENVGDVSGEVIEEEEFSDIDDEDELPSNWEKDVEEGKYDDYHTERTVQSVDINPVHSQTRMNISRIEEMQGKEQFEKYWDDRMWSSAKNSKPRRPSDDKESIRFDDAI